MHSALIIGLIILVVIIVAVFYYYYGWPGTTVSTEGVIGQYLSGEITSTMPISGMISFKVESNGQDVGKNATMHRHILGDSKQTHIVQFEMDLGKLYPITSISIEVDEKVGTMIAPGVELGDLELNIMDENKMLVVSHGFKNISVDKFWGVDNA